MSAPTTAPSAADLAPTPAEIRAYRAGVEAVRRFAQDQVELHQARVRREPNRRWSVTLGFLGAFGRVVEHCDALLADAVVREDQPCP